MSCAPLHAGPLFSQVAPAPRGLFPIPESSYQKDLTPQLFCCAPSNLPACWRVVLGLDLLSR